MKEKSVKKKRKGKYSLARLSTLDLIFLILEEEFCPTAVIAAEVQMKGNSLKNPKQILNRNPKLYWRTNMQFPSFQSNESKIPSILYILFSN